MAPSTLELQLMFEERFPSWVSSAVPVKVRFAPDTTAVPLAGLVIDTVGGLLVGVAATKALFTLSTPPVRVMPFNAGVVRTVERRPSLTCSYVQVGLYDQRRAAAPATCGEAIEVPLLLPYPLPRTVLTIDSPGAPRSTEVAP